MPRKPRLYLPGISCHVIQRGNNRDVCFAAEEDYQAYLEWLRDGAERYGCAVHAYVLMTNHVHLLVTPQDREGVSRLMQSVGRRYVQYFNHHYGRTGTLWEGRHKASLVDAERYLLTLYRYIELNPVRAGMVRVAKDYRWSSYRCNALGRHNPVITPHALFLALHRNEAKRHQTYRALFQVHMDPEEQSRIHRLSEMGMPVGNGRFQARIEELTGFRLGQVKRGRPRKQTAGDGDTSKSVASTG